MSRLNREFGGLPTPLLVVLLAILIVGGTVFFLNSGPGAGSVKMDEATVGFVPIEVDTAVPQVTKPEKPKIPRTMDDSDDILKGDLVKFHDKNGNVKFRARDPNTGVDANGNTIYVYTELMVGPSLGDNKLENKSKALKKGVSGVSPPRLTMKDGKLQVMQRTPPQQKNDK